MGVETVLAVGMAAGGSLLSAGGALEKGEGAQQAAEAAAAAAEFNAKIDRQRAAEERDQAKANAQDYARKGSDVVETAVALQGASGVTSQGSPLMVDENTVRQIALGVGRTLQGGELRAARLEEDAQLKTMQAAASRKAGEIAKSASYLDAGGSLLSGGSKIASSFIPGKGSIA